VGEWTDGPGPVQGGARRHGVEPAATPLPWPDPHAGLLGAALLYGDGAITPAISVLSAVEGLATVTLSMIITSVLAYSVSRSRGWSAANALLVTLVFVCIELAFLLANALLQHPGYPRHGSRRPGRAVSAERSGSDM